METGVRPLSDIPAINRFLSYCRIRAVPSKTVLIHAGDVPDVLYYVIKGSVEVLIEDEEGNEMVLAYLNKGQFFGEMGLFNEQPARSAWVRTAPVRARGDDLSRASGRSPPKARRCCSSSRRSSRPSRPHRTASSGTSRSSTSPARGHAIMDLCNEPDAMTHPEGTQIKVSRQELSRSSAARARWRDAC
jgi:CRP/FNR family cyclic AMP-dependent transcriptional regulator